MEYRQVVAITGMPGLYQLVSAQNNGAIVKNLESKDVRFVSARKHQLTPIDSIEIYTFSDNIRLEEVFVKIRDGFDDKALDANQKNDKNHFATLFSEVLPDYDRDRVYASDIKKVFRWYELLKNNDLLHFETEESEEQPNQEENTETPDNKTE